MRGAANSQQPAPPSPTPPLETSNSPRPGSVARMNSSSAPRRRRSRRFRSFHGRASGRSRRLAPAEYKTQGSQTQDPPPKETKTDGKNAAVLPVVQAHMTYSQESKPDFALLHWHSVQARRSVRYRLLRKIFKVAFESTRKPPGRPEVVRLTFGIAAFGGAPSNHRSRQSADPPPHLRLLLPPRRRDLTWVEMRGSRLDLLVVRSLHSDSFCVGVCVSRGPVDGCLLGLAVNTPSTYI